jgi:phthiocerol/phenolphthiocerol synthesis type-I polyketide synthase E
MTNEPRGMPDPPDDLDVAIIGMSGRFPGAANIDKFWQNLVAGVESSVFISEQEISVGGVGDAAHAPPK